ncbi:hypothetical protein GBAR_LOCUS9056 [Geodia barretti]|uniref:Uncharacterized protein n=1 Tax=Geodia barretti TaxID=519541 RepID=A0AA35RQ39_GEOBA|nr:hypothetical protein GBAR_LOCUS9056 [Geodia barretti]
MPKGSRTSPETLNYTVQVKNAYRPLSEIVCTVYWDDSLMKLDGSTRMLSKPWKKSGRLVLLNGTFRRSE